MISLLFLSLFALAETHCPKDSLRVEFISPATGQKKIMCQIKKDGKYETVAEISADGATTEKVETKLPGNTPDIKLISAKVTELLKIVSTEQQKSTSEFIVDRCDKNQLEWIKLALTKGKRQVSYSFAEKCDVEGNFEAQFGTLFPMDMKLRHLSHYTRTQMKVLLTITPSTQGIDLKFDGKEGILTSPMEKIEFKAWYSITINPLTGKPFPGTKMGEITILAVNEKRMEVKSPIHYD